MHRDAVIVVRAGLHTTVQDGGRWGYQHFGVPVGGALDTEALRRANALVGNAAEEAGLEFTLVGGTLRAAVPLHVAVTGARFEVTINGVPASRDTALRLAAGDALTLGTRRDGARAYVAVRGGLDVPVVLGSRSAWPMLPRRGALRDGAVLDVGDRAIGPMRPGTWPSPAPSPVLRVVPGPEGHEAAAALAALQAGTYVVAPTASRMAYPLEGPPVPLVAPTRASSGTVTGAIQVVPTGQPILLMAERQTTGGYPVVAVVITADLPHAAQLAPGDPVRFTVCTRAEAMRARLAQQDFGARPS